MTNTPNFEVIEFNPTIVELQNKVNAYKDLKIQDIEDEAGYELVKKAQLDLRDTRVTIEKFGKSLRDGANTYAKKVIEEEKKLIAIIEGTEKELKAERQRIDESREIEKRRKILPDRKNELERHGIVADDDKILEMTSDEFNKFVQDEREKILKAKEEQIENEKRQIILTERKKRFHEVSNMTMPDDVFLRFSDEHFDNLIEETKKQKEEAEAKAKKDAEEKIKKEQEDKEAKEKQDKIDEENKLKLQQERLEKEKKYNAWLLENNYRPTLDLIKEENGEFVMYRQLEKRFYPNKIK